VSLVQAHSQRLLHLSHHLWLPRFAARDSLKVCPCQGLMLLQPHSPRYLSAKKIRSTLLLPLAECLRVRSTPATSDVAAESKLRIPNRTCLICHTILVLCCSFPLPLLEPSAQGHHSTLALLLHHTHYASTENRGQGVMLGELLPPSSARAQRNSRSAIRTQNTEHLEQSENSTLHLVRRGCVVGGNHQCQSIHDQLKFPRLHPGVATSRVWITGLHVVGSMSNKSIEFLA